MEVLLGLMGIPSFFLLVSCKKPSDFSIALLGAGEPRSGSGLFIIFSDSNCFCLMDIQRRRPGGGSPGWTSPRPLTPRMEAAGAETMSQRLSIFLMDISEDIMEFPCRPRLS